MNDAVKALDELLHSGRFGELEAASRDLLGQHKFFLWHMYLIVALLRSNRKAEAGAELDALISYKFNLADRAWPEIREAFPDRFAGHFVLSTMKPEIGFETGARVKRHWQVPYPLADDNAFAAQIDQLIGESVPALPPLQRDATAVTTFGSCFAANLAQSMKAGGVNATNLLIEESINSPLANEAFLEAVARPEESRRIERIDAEFGPDFRPQAQQRLAQAQVIVMTLGVAPSFFHRSNGELVFLENYRELIARDAIRMRTPKVEEQKRTLQRTLSLVREINAGARLYMTISPVPLMGTAELSNAVVADCVSKTTLRATLHEVLEEGGDPQAIYWPSFEIVRWLGGHTRLDAYGADDKVSRHVSQWLIDLIVSRFVGHLFGVTAPAGSPQPPRPAPAQIPGLPGRSRWS